MGLSKTKQSEGVIPPQGVKLRVVELEPRETKEGKKLMYEARLEIIEPARYAGTLMRDWFVIGTDKDPRAKKAETWERSGPRDGPGRLARLFARSGTPVSDDDEEFCAAIENAEVCAHLGKRPGQDGTPENRIDLYFKETDKEFVGVGEKLTQEDAPGRGGRGNGPANARARAKASDEEEEGDEPPKRKGKAAVEEPEEEEDEKPAKSARRRRVVDDED